MSIQTRSSLLLDFEKESFSSTVATLWSGYHFLHLICALLGGSRLQNIHLNQTSFHPIILDRRSPLVRLLLRQFHISYGHAVPTTLVALVTEEFPIFSVTQIVWSLHASWSTFTLDTAVCQLSTPWFQYFPPFFKTGVDFAIHL